LAQSNLGFAYRDGEGVPQDYVQAHMWLNLAAAQAKPDDRVAAEARDKLVAKMTSAQIAEAQRLAREWKPTPER
jgi:TPR repeat protein